MAFVKRTSSKGAKASFTQTSKGTSIRVSPKGGVKVGPTHCVSKRSAPNLKQSYRSASTY